MYMAFAMKQKGEPMNRLFVMVCPWQKVTETYWSQVYEHTDKTIQSERFGECYGAKCPFFDVISETCSAIKRTNTMQR